MSNWCKNNREPFGDCRTMHRILREMCILKARLTHGKNESLGCWLTVAGSMSVYINSSPPRQNGRHFADDIFICIFVNEKILILIKISLKFVPWIDNNPALFYITAWRRAIIWSNADPVHWRTYAALRGDELTPPQLNIVMVTFYHCRSHLECSAACLQDNRCYGYIFNKTSGFQMQNCWLLGPTNCGLMVCK